MPLFPGQHTSSFSKLRRKFTLVACVGCVRLRRKDKFSPKMTKSRKSSGGAHAGNRFSIECGRRPLPGEYRYLRGCRWEEHGVPFVRCLNGITIVWVPRDQLMKHCLSCHSQDLEKEKAAEELERVRRETREIEQIWQQRAERRRRFIEQGGALSDSFSEDTSEENDMDV